MGKVWEWERSGNGKGLKIGQVWEWDRSRNESRLVGVSSALHVAVSSWGPDKSWGPGRIMAVVRVMTVLSVGVTTIWHSRNVVMFHWLAELCMSPQCSHSQHFSSLHSQHTPPLTHLPSHTSPHTPPLTHLPSHTPPCTLPSHLHSQHTSHPHTPPTLTLTHLHAGVYESWQKCGHFTWPRAWKNWTKRLPMTRWSKLPPNCTSFFFTPATSHPLFSSSPQPPPIPFSLLHPSHLPSPFLFFTPATSHPLFSSSSQLPPIPFSLLEKNTVMHTGFYMWHTLTALLHLKHRPILLNFC